MAYGDVKDLTRRIASHEILRDKALNMSKKIMDIKRVLLQRFKNFLIKKLLVEQLKKRICLI